MSVKYKMLLIKRKKKVSEETKKKISLAQIGKISPLRGRKLSEETKIKISNSLLGHIPWNKNKRYTLIELLGKERAEKIKRKMKGRISPMKGKFHSEESRKKMSLANKGQIPWMLGKSNS